MKRATASLDRVGTAVLGVAAMALGGAAIAWERGKFPNHERIDASGVETTVDAGWWPWATGAAAIVLLLLGVWWLLAHFARRSVGAIAFANAGVPDTEVNGSLKVDLGTVARSAARDLAAHDGIVSAAGRSISDRGQRVVEISATLDPTVASLAEVADAAAGTRRDVVASLDGTPTAVRILLHAGRTRNTAGRVD